MSEKCRVALMIWDEFRAEFAYLAAYSLPAKRDAFDRQVSMMIEMVEEGELSNFAIKRIEEDANLKKEETND